MNARRFAPIHSLLLMAVLAAPAALPAQQTVEITGRDRGMDAHFDEVYSVGVFEGESWEMFGQVARVAFDATGNLYVFDEAPSGGRSQVRVLVFDPLGRFLREFGSSGGGPGEFNRPVDFAVLRDGTVVASDAGHRAYQLFDGSGSSYRFVRAGNEAGGVPVLGQRIHPDPRGDAVFAFAGDRVGSIANSLMGGLRSLLDGDPTVRPMSRPVLRIELDGEAVHTDTVVKGWLPPRGDLEGQASNSAPTQVRDLLGAMTMPAVFEPALLVGVLPGGSIVHSDSSAYALKVTAPDSREIARILQRPLRPEPVTPAIKRDYQHRTAAAREECLASLIVVRVRGPAKVDLGQDLDDRAALRGDRAYVVARLELAAPAELKDWEVSVLLKRTCVVVGEGSQILQMALVESVTDAELFVLPNRVDS